MLEVRDYRFLELTRSLCPECRAVVDARVIDRGGKVYMRKRCPECGRMSEAAAEVCSRCHRKLVPAEKSHKAVA